MEKLLILVKILETKFYPLTTEIVSDLNIQIGANIKVTITPRYVFFFCNLFTDNSVNIDFFAPDNSHIKINSLIDLNTLDQAIIDLENGYRQIVIPDQKEEIRNQIIELTKRLKTVENAN